MVARPALRVYYESLEQALHFVTPLVRECADGTRLDVQYVRARWPALEPRGAIAAFLEVNSPDLLLSAVIETRSGTREYPLLAMEFSEAVKTEDHELQRATVAAASRFSGIPAVKVSGERKSAAEHGGNKAFDPLVVVRMFRSERCAARYFYQEWPSCNGRLVVQKDAIVCPEPSAVPVARALVEAAVAVACDPALGEKTTDAACAAVVAHAERTEALRAHKAAVERAVLQDVGLCAAVLGADRHDVADGGWVGRRACVSKDGTLFVKINRFDHSADPDRGVLTALSMAWPGKVLALYQIAERGKTKTRATLNRIFRAAPDVVAAFVGFAEEEGFPSWLLEAVTELPPRKWSDITNLVHASRKAWLPNKVLKTLFTHADGMLVQLARGGTTDWFGVAWSRETLGSRADVFYKAFDPGTPLPPLRVVEADRPNEDEVTYVTVHRVLRVNEFNVLHVSYPGHQGGEPILDSEESGRTRTRAYVDIVSVTPKPHSPSLTEAKDRPGPGLAADVEKLKKLRNEGRLREGLGDLLTLRGVVGWDGKRVLLSVAFGGGGKTEWDPGDVDFIIRLKGRAEFEVAPFGDAKRYFARTTSGPTGLPKVFVPDSPA